MATIEVAEQAPDLAALLADLDFDFRLDPMPAPSGQRRFALRVNARRGERRCALTAHRLLGALKSIAATGDLPGFAIVAGAHWAEHPGWPDPRNEPRIADSVEHRRGD
ncbi:MAG TPA: hypothetical protein VFS55_08430 [Dokdonella sp.]|nr:hypothetical protein [Dokdonella sp.]